MNNYEGVNGSTIEILGIVTAQISVGDSKVNDVMLKVVPERTMKCDLLLGRDAICKLGFGLMNCASEESTHNEGNKNEILL